MKCRMFVSRHVILPKDLAKGLPKSRVLTEQEWRGLGVQQSRGWMHYAIHRRVTHDWMACGVLLRAVYNDSENIWTRGAVLRGQIKGVSYS